MVFPLRHLCKETTLRAIACLGDRDELGFLEIGRRIDRRGNGYSESMRKLERDGLVTREIVRLMPPKTSYKLTPLGRSLVEPAKAMIGWLDHHEPHVTANREHKKALAAIAADSSKDKIQCHGSQTS